MAQLAPQIVLAIATAESIWSKHGGTTLVITSCNDGKHSERSFHYQGKAVDLRTKNLPDFARGQAVQELREALGLEFDVLHEAVGQKNEHAHVEYDVKDRK